MRYLVGAGASCDRAAFRGWDLLSEQVPKAPESETEKSIASLDQTRFADGQTPVAELRLKLQKDMQDHAAVYRTQDSLAEGVVSCLVHDALGVLMSHRCRVLHDARRGALQIVAGIWEENGWGRGNQGV